ncbi:E3 ubiquitin ligase PQT3-like [Lolium rigidum]|uniref:E3 ubiquitin ligase PQT3-like n=1 Tax=Lolium rigidum TaxID=89674 RepID=UPI001F5C6A51|nr:E3 ubiquitin ligase PQT3-like [Lolium rigidum]
MAVYYRYRSGVDTFSLPIAAPSVSVAELKRLIMGTSRHGHGRTRGRGAREGIAISDAQTGEEYADDNALVLRNSTVVVRRVAGPPAGTIVEPSTQRPKANQDSSSDSAASTSSASAGAEDDDEAKAISAVINAAELKWEGPSHYGHRGPVWAPPPPAGYVCHRCRVPGHLIQHCPTNGDPRFDCGKARTVLPQAQADDNDDDDGVPADLYCKICKNVMADAVMTSKCCFSSFCDRCIRAHIVANSTCACGARARADDLIPNPTLRTTISNILAARATSGSCGRTEKQRSSVGSNAETQSPAASRHSHASSKKGASSEHSDGSESSTSAPAAAHEPRKKERETTDTAGARAAKHADHQYGCHDLHPFPPACYNPFFPWSADPSMYYGYGYGGMPYGYGGGYPMGPHHVDAMGNREASYGYHGERPDGRKRTACEDQRQQDRSFKRRCGGSRSQVALVLT